MKALDRQLEILSILKQARLISQFSDKLLTRLINHSQLVSFEKDQVIVTEGVANKYFYVLMAGSVLIYSGTEFISRLSRKGDLFGELSALTQNITAASVQASSIVEALSVPTDLIFNSDDFELKAMIYKIAVDILSDKLKLTRTRVIGYQAVSEELSEKKMKLAMSENTLKQKDSILQSVLSGMSEGVVVTSAEGTLLHINPAFKKMMGNISLPLSIAEWPSRLGMYHRDRKTHFRLDELPMSRSLKDIGKEAVEMFVCNQNIPDGIWIQANSGILKQNGQPMDGVVAVFHDITQKMEEKLALMSAKKEAEAMAKAKTNFLAVTSHELRTPLNSILGTTDLLTETELNSEQEVYLNSIKASGQMLFTIIRNILDYNTLETGNYCMDSKPFSIRECFQEIFNSYCFAALKKNIKLNLEISESVPELVTGCEQAVKQVLRNLVDNAIKFTNQGQIEVKAQIDSSYSKKGVVFSVRDTGIGIAGSNIPYLFQPFSQVDTSYARRFDGTGIGLSISNRIVELLGSKLHVSSELGEGTEFSFSVSFLEKRGEAIKPMSNQSFTEQQNIELNQNFAKQFPMQILVAEDNILNQKLIQKMLQKLGYDPTIVENGNGALEAVKNNRFRILLMDLQMPEVDGIEATQLILEQVPADKQPNIIALTAAVSNDVRQNCLSVGMKGFISKPISMRKLSEILQEFY